MAKNKDPNDLGKNSMEDICDSDTDDDNESLTNALLLKNNRRRRRSPPASSPPESSPPAAKTNERPKLFRASCELQADTSKLLILTTMLAVTIGSFLLGMGFKTLLPSSSCSLNHDSVTRPTNPVHELGWSVVVENIRVDLGEFYEDQYEKEHPLLKTSDNESPTDQTVEITRYYELISYALDTIGVRGVYDDLFDEMDWYVDDEPDNSHGIGNVWYGWFWLVHYTGAITAEKLLADGSLLLDGSTGERLTDAVSFVREIQRIQKQPRIDETTFHAMHSFIWYYVASSVPDLETYPTQLATEFCGDYVVDDFRSKSAHKNIGEECYHGFGHAVFYVMAVRQLKKNHKNQGYELDARRQLRPEGGFQLDDKSFCHAYKICGAAPNATVSIKPRKRCIGGIRHSTKLFARLKEGQEVADVVTDLEEQCDIASDVLKGLSW